MRSARYGSIWWVATIRRATYSSCGIVIGYGAPGLMGGFTRLVQRLGATSLFHLPEIALGGVYPFCGQGWSIAVACQHADG